MVVASQYLPVLQMLRKELNEEVGKTRVVPQELGLPKVMAEAQASFSNSPDCSVLLLQLGQVVAGHLNPAAGLDLSCAQHLLFMEPPLLPHHMEEAIGACSSLPVNSSVEVIVLVAEGTMEVSMLEIGMQYIGYPCTGSSVYSSDAALLLSYVERLLLGEPCSQVAGQAEQEQSGAVSGAGSTAG